MKLENAISEIDKVFVFYKNSDVSEARKCYDQYINRIIKLYIPREHQEFHRDYWENLKRGEQRHD